MIDIEDIEEDTEMIKEDTEIIEEDTEIIENLNTDLPGNSYRDIFVVLIICIL